MHDAEAVEFLNALIIGFNDIDISEGENNAKVVCSMLQMDYVQHGVDYPYGQFKVIGFEIDEHGEFSEPYFRGNGGNQYQAVLKTVMCKPRK